MKTLLLILISVFLSEARAFDVNRYSLQNGCTVHDTTGKKILEVPGSYCVFLDDGSVVSASSTSLRLLGPDLSVQWTLDIPVHHQVNLSEDRQKILFLSSSYVKIRNRDFRDDRFVIVSMKGEILHDVSISALLPEDKLLDLPITNEVNMSFDVRAERSHFNSIFEIPAVKPRDDAPWLRGGNIIANSVKLGIVILSPDLSKVLHHFTYPRSRKHQVHDAKILPSGKLLLFNNHAISPEKIAYSTVDEVDPVTFAPEFILGNNQKEHFFAGSRSGTHSLGDDIIVFSLEWQGVYAVSKRSRTVIFSNHEVNKGKGWIISNQEVRILDLRSFLANHKGPQKIRD